MNTEPRFTHAGSESVEQQLRHLISKLRQLAKSTRFQEAGVGLILIGGYGRGEGGVERTHGLERPHNNLDLVLVTQKSPESEVCQTWRREYERELAPLRRSEGIGIDLSVMRRSQFHRSRGMLMGYDARHGHRVIAGPENLLSGLGDYETRHIDPASVADLWVNRGTLLIVNRQLLNQAGDEISSNLRRTLVRHAMKAIIGYGDAWLYRLGLYHWSYVTKLERMLGLSAKQISPELRDGYLEAASFRLEPDYNALDQPIDQAWNQRIVSQLLETQLALESKPNTASMANKQLSLSDRVERIACESWSRPRRCLGSLVHCLKHARDQRLGRMQHKLLTAGLGPRRWLRLAYPYVAFGLGTAEEREAIAVLLGAELQLAHQADGLDHAYLNLWGGCGDTNFHNLTATQPVLVGGSAS